MTIVLLLLATTVVAVIGAAAAAAAAAPVQFTSEVHENTLSYAVHVNGQPWLQSGLLLDCKYGEPLFFCFVVECTVCLLANLYL